MAKMQNEVREQSIRTIHTYRYQLLITQKFGEEGQPRGIAFVNDPVSEGETIALNGIRYQVISVSRVADQSEPTLIKLRLLVEEVH